MYCGVYSLVIGSIAKRRQTLKVSRLDRINEKLRMFDCYISVTRHYGNAIDLPVVLVQVDANHGEDYKITFMKREGHTLPIIDIEQKEETPDRKLIKADQLEEEFVFRMLAILDLFDKRLS